MFVYEKNGKLNIAFQNTQIPPEQPDIILDKDVDISKIFVDGSAINTTVTFEDTEESGDIFIG